MKQLDRSNLLIGDGRGQKDIIADLDVALATDPEVAMGPEGSVIITLAQRHAANSKSILNNKIYTARSKWGLIEGKPAADPTAPTAAKKTAARRSTTTRYPVFCMVNDDGIAFGHLGENDVMTNVVGMTLATHMLSLAPNTFALQLASQFVADPRKFLLGAVELVNGKRITPRCKIDGVEYDGNAADVLNAQYDAALVALKTGDADAKTTARKFLARDHKTSDIATVGKLAAFIEANYPAPAVVTPTAPTDPTPTETTVSVPTETTALA